MRRKMVAGNWKMNPTRSEAKTLLENLKKNIQAFEAIDVVVFPTSLHIPLAADILAGSPVAWGGQNIYTQDNGAFTGEISASMLAEFGCRYVLTGHSERRAIFHEDLDLIAEKFQAALKNNLIPILCVGETLKEREENKTHQVIEKQLSSVIQAAGITAFKKALVAYEPVWAIGTGKTATPEMAEEVHSAIRNIFSQESVEVAKTVRILYGGSVKADNAKGLFEMPNIDGGLVGGASLDIKGFLGICEAAKEVSSICES